LKLEIIDNGNITDPIILGNGIHGMRERINRIKGDFSMDITSGCVVKVVLYRERKINVLSR
jgi:signal transduction histidine kinase